MASDVRVGVIGAGDNTRKRHIPGLRAIEGVEIVGVANRSRESSRRVAEDFGIERVYDHWREAIDDPETNAIVIGTWPYLHARATIAALEAGKHVMTEARMSATADEAHAMRHAADARPGLVAQVVPSPFTLDRDRTIQRMIGEGFLGDPVAVELRLGGAFLDRSSPLHWRQDLELNGLNILGLGIWYEAIMRWLGEATRVSARGRTIQRMRPDADGTPRAVRVPEHVDVIGEMACGAQLHMQQSAATGHMEGLGCYLAGTEGTIHVPMEGLRAGKRGDEGLSPVAVPEAEAEGWRVEAEFVGAIRGEEPIRRTTFADGVKYMEFTEAVARSIATGESVPLPLRFA